MQPQYPECSAYLRSLITCQGAVGLTLNTGQGAHDMRYQQHDSQCLASKVFPILSALLSVPVCREVNAWHIAVLFTGLFTGRHVHNSHAKQHLC